MNAARWVDLCQGPQAFLTSPVRMRMEDAVTAF
jgi:hypothetical protein